MNYTDLSDIYTLKKFIIERCQLNEPVIGNKWSGDVEYSNALDYALETDNDKLVVFLVELGVNFKLEKIFANFSNDIHHPVIAHIICNTHLVDLMKISMNNEIFDLICTKRLLDKDFYITCDAKYQNFLMQLMSNKDVIKNNGHVLNHIIDIYCEHKINLNQRDINGNNVLDILLFALTNIDYHTCDTYKCSHIIHKLVGANVNYKTKSIDILISNNSHPFLGEPIINAIPENELSEINPELFNYIVKNDFYSHCQNRNAIKLHLINKIIKNKYDVNRQDKFGRTSAFYVGRKDILKVLLDADINLNIKDCNMLKAVDFNTNTEIKFELKIKMKEYVAKDPINEINVKSNITQDELSKLLEQHGYVVK